VYFERKRPLRGKRGFLEGRVEKRLLFWSLFSNKFGAGKEICFV